MGHLLRLITAACVALLLSAVARADDTMGDCHVGAYRLADAALVDLAPSENETFRWRGFDGTTGSLHKSPDGSWSSTLGWTERPDGKTVSFSECAAGEIHFGGVVGHRIAF